jgi:hypothetical protein
MFGVHGIDVAYNLTIFVLWLANYQEFVGTSSSLMRLHAP